MKNKAFPIVVAILVVCGIGLGVYLTHRNAPESVSPPVERQKTPSAAQDQPQEVKVYQVVVENNQPRLQATTQIVSSKDNVIELAMHKLVEQGSTDDMTNPIPKGTKVLGVDVKDGLATVDFSSEFRDNFTGGSEGEALVIGVILRTMGQFDEVKRVQILVQGKPIDSLGHAPLSEPLDVSWVSPEFGE